MAPLIEAYSDLIRRKNPHGRSFGVYCHRLGDTLPNLSYRYSDYRTVCSSVVLKIDENNWSFVSNAKVGLRDPIVNIYCSSKVQFADPIPDELRRFLVHFFPSKNIISVHEQLNEHSQDQDGSLTALLHLYSTIVTDRTIKFNVLSDSKVKDNVLTALEKSVKEDKLYRFTDNECYSVFVPTFELAPLPSYTRRFIDTIETESLSTGLLQNYDCSEDSDDDFEDSRHVAKRPRKNIAHDNSYPRYTEPSENERVHSKQRLASIRSLCKEGQGDVTAAKPSKDVKCRETVKTLDASTVYHSSSYESEDARVFPFDEQRDVLTVLTAAAESDDKTALETFKQKTRCKKRQCLNKPNGKRIVHFHCLTCRKHFSFHFQREVDHMLKCQVPYPVSVEQDNKIGADNQSDGLIETDDTTKSRKKDEHTVSENDEGTLKTKTEHPTNDCDSNTVTCWDTDPKCITRPGGNKKKHYHCKICGMASTEIKRIRQHATKCQIQKTSSNYPHATISKANEECDKKSLQAELICIKSGIYLVRRGTQGPASPVHVMVNKKGWECTAPHCQDMYNFHQGSLCPSFMCDHALACINLTSGVGAADLVNDQISFSNFGEDDRENLLSFCKNARDFGVPVVKQFVPTMIDKAATSRYIYYSIFSGTTDTKYYSKLGRVLVTYDRSTKAHKCDCSVRSCLHKKIAVLVSEVNPLVKESRPEDDVDDEEIQLAENMIDYVLTHKTIPFDVSGFMKPKGKTEFAPVEMVCHKCENSPLVVADVNSRGYVFTLESKTGGIKVVTKKCPNCNMQYRYSEYSEGYFNYNNSSFFSIAMMETALAAWTEKVSLTQFFNIKKVSTGMDYNIHLILDAVKAYMALKDFKIDEHLNCYRCGHFPVCLSYDVIRSVCFDVDPGDVTEYEYTSPALMQEACSKYNLASAYMNRKSRHYNSNLKHFSIKLGPHLPPVLSANNFGGLSPYTRPLVDSDKAEEVRLPLERIEQIVASKNAYKELKSICESLNIETKGGKSHMVARLVDSEENAELYSVVRKKFTKIVGKSGGVLRSFCPHGICYGLKFLTLPESVADYTNLMTAFKVQPSFNFTDMPSVVANHTNNHFPNFFRPHRGRIDDPEDPNSHLYKDGRKKAIFDFNRFANCELNLEEYDHDSVHPITRLSSVLSLSDIFHEKNHHEFDAHLRSVQNTNLATMWNTSIVEQKNHILSLTKSFCNEMGVNCHIRFVTYLSCVHNKHINEKWKTKMEKSTKKRCVIDELGFLTLEGVSKLSSSELHVQSSTLRSPYPTAILQDPSGDASALNSVANALAHSHIGTAILESQSCIGHELLSFAAGKRPYDQPTHFKMKKMIDKHVVDASGNASDPTALLTLAFLPDLLKLGTLVKSECAASPNLGIALGRSLQNEDSVVDYVVIKRSKPECFNGCRTHYNIDWLDNRVKYKVAAFVAETSSEHYSCFLRSDENFYEMTDLKCTLLTENAFLEYARAAVFIIFKLDTPISENNTAYKQRKPNGNAQLTDVFDFLDNKQMKRTLPPGKAVQRKKTKIGPDQQFQSVSNDWLGYSETGRLDMYSEQFRICQNAVAWYDDIIINSYARMCQIDRSNSFVYQDTCLANAHRIGGFQSVDQKFIQILNPTNNHWFCVSNALTYRYSPQIIEVFDSLASSESLGDVKTLDSLLSTFILQLKPQATEVRYIKTQKQGNGHDCGPLALSFLWSLSKGHHPLQYEHIRGPIVRKKVRQSFIENRFIPPCLTCPRNYTKVVIKTFKLNPRGKQFHAA